MEIVGQRVVPQERRAAQTTTLQHGPPKPENGTKGRVMTHQEERQAAQELEEARLASLQGTFRVHRLTTLPWGVVETIICHCRSTHPMLAKIDTDMRGKVALFHLTKILFRSSVILGKK